MKCSTSKLTCCEAVFEAVKRCFAVVGVLHLCVWHQVGESMIPFAQEVRVFLLVYRRTLECDRVLLAVSCTWQPT